MALLSLSESFVAAVTGAGSPVSSLADAYSEAAKAMAQVFSHCSAANLRVCRTSVPLIFGEIPATACSQHRTPEAACGSAACIGRTAAALRDCA